MTAYRLMRPLAALVIAEGLGREYDGGARLGWCDG